MRIQTSRFGVVEVKESDTLFLIRGLLGFPSLKECGLLRPDEDAPFEWLLACDDPALSFPVADLRALLPGCHPNVHDQDLEELGAGGREDLEFKVLLRIPDGDPSHAIVNLKAPIVINIRNRRAKQVVLSDAKLSHHHPIFPQA